MQCWESNRSQKEGVAAVEEEHLWLQLALRLRCCRHHPLSIYSLRTAMLWHCQDLNIGERSGDASYEDLGTPVMSQDQKQ